MADERAAAAAPSRDSRGETMALVIGVAGWIVPGLGHALLKMWGRAVTCFLTVGILVILGAGMRGNVFSATAGVLNLLSALHAYEAARGRKA